MTVRTGGGRGARGVRGITSPPWALGWFPIRWHVASPCGGNARHCIARTSFLTATIIVATLVQSQEGLGELVRVLAYHGTEALGKRYHGQDGSIGVDLSPMGQAHWYGNTYL